jgi:mutator protein MutT
VQTPRIDIGLALVRRGERWLVTQRRPDAHLGGLWEFPGGKRDGAETIETTALRELHEECAVRANAERVLPPVEWDYAERRVRLWPVVCRWVSGEGEARASVACQWVTAAELAQLPMPAANAVIVRALSARV